MNSSKRKFNFSGNEASFSKIRKDSNAAISAMIYQTGSQNARNVHASSNNPLSPRIADNLKRFMNNSNEPIFSPAKHSQAKNSKVMKKYYESSKGYRSSRNLEMSKRVKNATQLVALPSSSRNVSSNVNLNNLSATSRIKNSFKSSIGGGNAFSTRSKTKESKKKVGLRDRNLNRRATQRNRGSVENFKSDHTNRSVESKESRLRQST